MVLSECSFKVPEVEVIRAVTRWTEVSPWVKSTYAGAPMQQDQIWPLMDYTDPRCLTVEEYAKVDTLFREETSNQVRPPPPSPTVLCSFCSLTE
jgi:hypothetical protein